MLPSRRLSSLLLLLSLPAAPAVAQTPECSRYPSGAPTYSCSCAAGPHQGSVWGSGPYTGDSDLCTAALHAGVIGMEGGEVTATAVAPPADFAGTTANGVSTRDWGSYPEAFAFEGAQAVAGLPACRGLGPTTVTECACPAGPFAGSVWGSDPYTDDSDLCTAALHAGVIGPLGGNVTVRRTAGQQSYVGSERNGVTTADYGAWGRSFTFEAKP